MTHALTEKAMVMNLSIGVWVGQRLDREATTKITTEAGAHADAARVNKHLIPKEALKDIVTAQNTVRSHFYTKTLPWRDNGDRLMTRVMYLDFIPKHEELVAEFDREVAKFLNERYPAAIEQAAFRMGAMFNPDDYPPSYQLRRKFYIGLEIDAVTTANDFRVQIDAEHVEKVKASMTSAAEARINAAMADVWKRMADTVGYFQERMAKPDAVFRDSTVTNIGEMLDLIPGLNVLDDPDIELVRGQIAKAFGNIDAVSIRKDPAHREELAGEASEIMSKMQGFMKAFGGGQA